MALAPTIDDVARVAGVSTATVSRCLNQPEKVQDQTRTKVNAAIDKLGYAPNFGAQVLASQRTRTVGAVIPTMDNAIFARGLQAFQETLSEAGFHLLVSGSDYQPEKELRQIRIFAGRGVDGLLLIGRERPQETYQFLADRQVPFVQAWGTDPDRAHLFAGFDNRAAAFEMAGKVASLGHRAIAVISGRMPGNDRAADRVTGIREALQAGGLDPSSLELIECTYSLDAGGEAFGRLMRLDRRPTAVICGNDVLAAGALGEALRLGMAVPGDVSIVGFDDIDIARATSPQITTVHVPHRRMGRAAADLLLAMCRGQTGLRSVTLKTSLVMRESLGPASG